MKRFVIMILGLVLISRLAYSQNTITGIVMDAQSLEPLAGVSIVAVKNKTGTITRSNGTFTIQLPRPEDSLSVSSVGYKPEKIAVSESQLKISLIPLAASLNELVVTAGRTAQERTEAPVAIGVISSEMMRQTKPATLDQVLNKVSGVYMVDLGNEQHTMAIRQPISYRSNFLYLQDGIPIRTIGDFNHNALIEINQAAVKRIEVVKGPSSSLYGSDAIGGVINFITKKPTVVPDAKVELEGSSWGYRRINLTAGNTFNQTGLLLSGYYARQHNGYMQHSDFNKLALTARVDQQLSKNSRLTGLFTGINYRTDMTGGLDSAHFFDKNYQSFYTFNYRKVQAWRGRLSWDHNGKKQQHSRLTLYYRHNQVGQNPHYRIKTTNDPFRAKGEVNNDFFQSYGLQGQYSRKLKKWRTELLVGFQTEYSPAGFTAHFIDIDRNAVGYFTDYKITDSLLTDYKVNIGSAAAFLRLQTAPVSGLRFTAGLRYDRLDYHFDNDLPPSAYSGSPDGHDSFQQLSPKIGATYDLGKDRGLYANYSIGFAPPDISDLYTGVKIPYLKSSRYFNYELGGWFSFNDHKGYVDVSLYRMNGRNEIVSVRLPDGSYINKNAGRTLHYGVEYTLKYNPVPQWRIRLSGTNTRHLFTEYEEKGKSYDGNEMNGAPHWIANAQASFYPAFLKGLNASLEWQHLSSYFMDEANTQRYPGYNVFNVRVNYHYKRFEVWAHLVNVFNVIYATTAEKSVYGVTYRPGPLRTLYLGIGYHFTGHSSKHKNK